MIETRKINLNLVFSIIAALFISFIWVFYARGIRFALFGFFAAVLVLFYSKEIFFLYLFVAFFWYPRYLDLGPLEDLLHDATLIEVGLYAGFIGWLIKSMLLARSKVDVRKIIEVPFFLPLLLFFLGGLIAFLLGNPSERMLSYDLVRENCFYGLILYLLCSKLIKNSSQLNNCITAMIIGGCVLGSRYWYIFKYSPDMITDTAETLRLGGAVEFGKNLFAVHALALADYLSSLATLSFSLFLLSPSCLKRYLGLGALCALSYLLVLTGSRSCWFGTILGLSVVFILATKYSRPHLLRVTLAIFLFTIGCLFIVNSDFLGPELWRRIQSIKNVSQDVSLLDRLEIWKGALMQVFSNPMGLGFEEQYKLGSLTTAHNIYLSIGLAHGLLGLTGFIWFVLVWFKKIFIPLKAGASRDLVSHIGIIGAVLAFLFNGFFDSYNLFFLNISQMWIIFGISVFLLKKNEV
ncbi:MAG: O-antigen ligase family protein [Candidatus Omnitrophica bacterium]|nr:O-antigen ligase family protein [Candidatus Omnitrophota bacterium]